MGDAAAAQNQAEQSRLPWNRGRLLGQKPPLKLREVWAIRIRLQIAERLRDLALFNLAIDSKLRGCDLVSLRVDDVLLGGRIRPRATVLQRKTGRPRSAKMWQGSPSSTAVLAGGPSTGRRGK